MVTWIIVSVVVVALLAVAIRIGNRQRRGERLDDTGHRQVSSRATGTTQAYHKDI